MKHYTFVLTVALLGASSANSQITLNPVPERAVGTPQLTVTSTNPNLVAGREFYSPQAVALDNSVSPPRLYVSDYANNRVLAWKNAASFTTGQTADLAIGQPNLLTTFAEGPAAVSTYSSSSTIPIPMPTTGLSRPSGLAVDANGNLYVVDAGNNRILRYPKPFAQTGQYPVPDMWIGQTSLATATPNSPGGTSTPTAQGLLLTSGSTALVSTLAFDSSGNLWALDTGNARVLRFNASSLSGTGGGISADTEIGQLSLTQNNASALSTSNSASLYVLNQFIAPSSIGFDSSGNLYVGDLSRVMVFSPPFSSGMSASAHEYGVFATTYTGTASTALQNSTFIYAPTGLFFPPGELGVVDAGNHRIMIFPGPGTWPTDGSPAAATAILGQPNTNCLPTSVCKANNGSITGPSNSVFAFPGGAIYTSTDLYLADQGNNRVLDLPVQSGAVQPSAVRVLGQDYFNTDAANLIEGREFQFIGPVGNGAAEDAGIAIDNSSGTPHLYVADPYNNRVLGFKDLRTFQNGASNTANIVLGQATFSTNIINYPTGNPNSPSSSSLYRPIGLTVDSNGNLYVADSLNGRVLRFPAPFSYTGAAPEPADLVLGQQNFTTTITDPSATNMFVPYGLAFTPSCNTVTGGCPPPNGLLVSDEADNRVLYIPTTQNGTFVAGQDNGKAATMVFGQTSFESTAAGAGSTLGAGMNSPHHISCDTSGNVYVADTGNNRILIFNNPYSAEAPATGAPADAVGGFESPESIFANPVTGEIWVADTGANASFQWANELTLLLGLSNSSNGGILESSGNFAYSPLDAIQDQYGDLFVADSAHRIAMYYPGVNLCNGASFIPAELTSSKYPSDGCFGSAYDSSSSSTVLPAGPLAPGMWATIKPGNNFPGSQFLTVQNTAPCCTFPTTLGGVQVVVNWTDASNVAHSMPAPLYIVWPNQINFIMPNEAPSSGTADLEVIETSTGQILGAAGQVPMYTVAPAAFECGGGPTGTVYICAINDVDGTVNGASNPAQPGAVVSLYMTGQGYIPGLPPDGTPAASAISAQYGVTVLMNLVDVNSPTYQEQNIQHVLYSGINAIPGMWQINVQIPKTVVPVSGAVSVNVEINNLLSWNAASGFTTSIYVK